MTALAAWLDGRAPEPPAPLSEALADDVVSLDDAETSLVDALATLAKARLSRARSRPGRVRTSAFDLLAADALLTYACEAALETDDPGAALERVLEACGDR